ncbi:MAG: SRPBCC family protein [Solirubrobacteraceae bacterium]
MAPITTTVEVARPPERVFAYVTDPSTMHEWQQGCVSGRGRAHDSCRLQVHDHPQDRRPRARGHHRDHRLRPAEAVGRSRDRWSDQSRRRGHGRAARRRFALAPDDRPGLHRTRDRKTR